MDFSENKEKLITGHPTKHYKNYYGSVQLLIKKEQDGGVTTHAWDKNNLGQSLLPFFYPPKARCEINGKA